MGVAWGIRPDLSPDSLPVNGEHPASPPQLEIASGGEWIALVSDTLGPGSNNQAEYHALIGGLRHAHRLCIRRLLVVGDSMLVTRQMQRVWRVRSQEIQDLSKEARALAGAFTKISFKHVSREFHIQKQIDDLSRREPFVKGETGFKPRIMTNDRCWTNKQAAFAKWAFATGRLSVSVLARIFLTDPSTMRKCVTGDTYSDIGVDDL